MTAPVLDPPAICASFIGARRLRATRLDSCGRVVYGPKSQVVSSGFVSVEIGPEVEEGEDYTQKTAGGDLCISEKGQDNIKWFTVAIEFCAVDPDLFLIMNPTWKPVTNAKRTTTTGWRIGQKFSDSFGFALELWPKAASGATQICIAEQDGSLPVDHEVNGYFLLPWVLGTAPDSWTLENGAATFKLQGRTRAGSLWGRGPYKVTRDGAGNPAPLLDPIDPGFDIPAIGFKTSGDPDYFHAEVITVKPPDPSCGAQSLTDPGAVAPTITVAPTPGNSMSVDLTVTNFDQVGRSGTVNWGDGKAEPVGPATGGKISHLYDTSNAGQPQTIVFQAGNGAAPATATFTPTGGTAAQITVAADQTNPMQANLTVTNLDQVGGAGTVDWGDGTPPQQIGTGGQAQITVAAATANPMQADLTVTNWDAIGGAGTVNWGDGTPPEPVQPGGGPAAQITVAPTAGNPMSADLTVTNFDQVGGAGTVAWGDGTPPEPVQPG